MINRVLFIALLTVLFSCKTNTIQFIIEDEVFMPGDHIHFEGECSWSLDTCYKYTDTLILIVPKKKKNERKKALKH